MLSRRHLPLHSSSSWTGKHHALVPGELPLQLGVLGPCVSRTGLVTEVMWVQGPWQCWLQWGHGQAPEHMWRQRCRDRVKAVMRSFLLCLVFSSFTLIGILALVFQYLQYFISLSNYPTALFRMYFTVGMFPTSRKTVSDVLRRYLAAHPLTPRASIWPLLLQIIFTALRKSIAVNSASDNKDLQDQTCSDWAKLCTRLMGKEPSALWLGSWNRALGRDTLRASLWPPILVFVRIQAGSGLTG